ncbi:HNH endonuclease [Sphaerochaeta globosa]|uniref:HNH domain-containing protein n=1 Tax=Sphaerochaeta globosa (strain ATCC BAA-1886 / DSM 22777 / Buddy) TaxID=158189 RepID=F0RTE8_SPHGB|nr:HNH endonuclease [Sphaerochaeta globosa]ADY14430.1 hypothetical protein SpiBuddy_2619 [Sphaerochaeta globosa str. Buddy]
MQQEYFERYLLNIRDLSTKSIENYKQALRKIDSVLQSNGFNEYASIYEIDSYAELQDIEQMLKRDEDFCALDSRGKQMYTAGLHNYMNFVEGKEFERKPAPLALIDYPVIPTRKRTLGVREEADRDRIIVRQVLIAEHFQCESDSSHRTFTSVAYKMPYMEGHHLIPLKQQEKFEYSLDVYANILSLCPICHRLLHHGVLSEKKPVWKKLFDERKERLEESGIRLGPKEFLDLITEDESKRLF